MAAARPMRTIGDSSRDETAPTCDSSVPTYFSSGMYCIGCYCNYLHGLANPDIHDSPRRDRFSSRSTSESRGNGSHRALHIHDCGLPENQAADESASDYEETPIYQNHWRQIRDIRHSRRRKLWRQLQNSADRNPEIRSSTHSSSIQESQSQFSTPYDSSIGGEHEQSRNVSSRIGREAKQSRKASSSIGGEVVQSRKASSSIGGEFEQPRQVTSSIDGESVQSRQLSIRSSRNSLISYESPIDRASHARTAQSVEPVFVRNTRSLESRSSREIDDTPPVNNNRSSAGTAFRRASDNAQVDPHISSRGSKGTGHPRAQGRRDRVVGAGVWSGSEQSNRYHESHSRQSNRIHSGSYDRRKRETMTNSIPLRERFDKPISFGRKSNYEIQKTTFPWEEYWKSNAPTGWMPPFPSGNSVRSWVEEVAYEAANNCGGDENVQRWVLEVIDTDHDGYNLRLPSDSSWRALDINIADEIKSLVNKAGDKYQTVRGNLTLQKRKAMRERRILGGRELMVAVINSYGPFEKRNCINDLMQMKPPNVKSLEQFYIDWKDTLIDINERDHAHEIKAILEQKLDESQLFDHELRTIDLWDLPDDEVYRTYVKMIEKRIIKESRKTNDIKRKNTAKIASEQHNPISGDDDRRERRTQPRREDLPPVRENTQKYEEQFDDVPQHPPVANKIANEREYIDPLTRFLSSGKGKGKSKGQRYNDFENPILKSPLLGTYIPPNRGRLDDELLRLSHKFGSCRDFAAGKCHRMNCRFPHLTREEMRSKERQTIQDNANADE